MSTLFNADGQIERTKGNFTKQEVQAVKKYFKERYYDVKANVGIDKNVIYFSGDLSISRLDTDEHQTITAGIRKIIIDANVFRPYVEKLTKKDILS